jgi:ubiquinone biosynthesis protein
MKQGFEMPPHLHHQRGKHRRSSRATESSSPAAGNGYFSTEHQARRLRLFLQELGPEHSSLALYLSSRIDLLPAEFCRELALTPDAAPPIPSDEIQRTMAEGLGAQLERAFAGFDLVPVESTLISQSHRALLRTGVPVIVAVLRPCFYKLRGELDASQILDAETIADYCGEWMTADLLRDFITSLRRKTNLSVAREGMELMARDAASFELLRSRRSYSELSTENLLTFEPLKENEDEERLDRILDRHSRSNDAIARALCHVWLQQALHGRCFPVDAHLHNIRVDEQNRISFLNCDLVGLPTGAKENLLSYFNCMMADDPDRAAMYLLREMIPVQAARIDADSFRSSFRQAAYFGMLEPILGTNSNSLAQMVFQHWKTTLDHGYVPKPHLLCFYRGLFSIARTARKLAPESDPLREGMEELRTSGAFNQLREIMDWRYWFQNSDKFASAMVQLPRTFDDALTRASAPSGALPDDRQPQSRANGPASPALLVLLSIALLVISQLPQTHAWSDKIIPAALMLAGLLVLRGWGR